MILIGFRLCKSQLQYLRQIKPFSHDTGRIFDRLYNLTRHFVHTGWFNILALFTRNFELPGVRILVRLRWLRVNGTPKRTKFQPVENSSGSQC